MKTLFVFNHPAPYKVHVFNELSKLADIQVIFERRAAKNRPESFYKQNLYNFPVIFLKRGAFSDENTYTGELRKYIKLHHQEYDTIVMNGYSTFAEMKAIRYMIKHHIPYVLQINGGVIKKESKLKKKIKTYYISHAAKYFSPCTEADKYLIYYGAKKENIFHYPYGNYFSREVIEKPLTRNEKDAIRRKYNLPLNRLFVNASQFIDRKNNMELLSIFKDRKETLLLIGEGNELKKYNDFIVNNKIQNVIILPFKAKEDLFEYFRACDGFISLAKEDIFGHTIIEALANGLPVIASNKVNSALEYIKDGYNGYIVDIEDENTINKAIDEIVNINALNCVKSVKNNTFENCGKVLFDILAEENQ